MGLESAMVSETSKPNNPFIEPNDKLGFSKVLDKYSMHVKNGTDEFTEFLDPKSIGIFLCALKKHRIEPIIYGGHAASERSMMGFCESAGSFPISTVLITFNQRFSSPPTHRHYLGSLIGLGLDRGKLGDISITMNGAIVYAHNSIAAFLIENLKKVGKTSVKTIIYENIDDPTAIGISKRIAVASLRLDVFVAATFNLSRTKANELIESQKVFVNFRNEKKTHILKVNDKISARGHGRVEIESIEGISKKGKIVLVIKC